MALSSHNMNGDQIEADIDSETTMILQPMEENLVNVYIAHHTEKHDNG